MKRILASLAILVAALLAGTGHAEEAKRKVSVSAQSEVVVDPDEAEVLFAVVADAINLPAALDANERITRSVLRLTRDLDLGNDSVKVTDFDVRAKFNRDREFNGYEVSRSFEIRVHDFAKVDRLIGGLVAAGVRSITRLHFQVQDQRKHQTEARRLAFQYAKQKASHLAELSNLTLGDVLTVEEGVQYNQDATGAGMGGFGGGMDTSQVSPPHATPVVVEPSAIPNSQPRTRLIALADVERRPANPPSGDGNLAVPGKVRLQATVSVEFELVKK